MMFLKKHSKMQAEMRIGVVFSVAMLIGFGAIVASDTLVTKDVPSYSIVGGPAKIISY